MRLDDRLLDFLNRPLMCIIAVADETGRPSAGRGVGFHLLEDRETIDVIFSAWQWPRLEIGIRQNGRIAATFVSPSDYVSFQLKGTATMRDTETPDLDRADRFMTAATDELESLGVPRRLIAPWLTAREARVARLVISEIYVQTPGPLAGMLAGTHVGARSQ
ncbi:MULTISPECIES: pyridoxamine 5'-phosphate oxidase family protein [unclassified Sinorhizobium]|uniref:pyridoxamine 5'-phosphate oxidase family protein n=1 Tax=unclassified Sinorhizobium TaxID=2613772 RepID=UPI003525CFB1